MKESEDSSGLGQILYLLVWMYILPYIQITLVAIYTMKFWSSYIACNCLDSETVVCPVSSSPHSGGS